MSEHSLILVTVGGKEEAVIIARRLVEDRLAAGVQIIPIESVYTWQDEIVESKEFLLIVKTRTERFEDLRSRVESLHSYQVPPILRMDIQEASLPYLNWINRSVKD